MSSGPPREVLESFDSFEASNTPTWVFDQQTLAFLEVNAAALRKYGYSRREFLKLTILDIRPYEDVPKLLNSALRPHATQGDVWKHRAKNRSVFSVRIVSRLVVFRGREAELVSAEEVPSEADAAWDTPDNSSVKGFNEWNAKLRPFPR